MSNYQLEILQYTFQGLFHQRFGLNIESINQINPGASNRKIYRLKSGSVSAIGVINDNVSENLAFIYFASVFRDCGFNVPEIYGVSDDKKFYIEEDLGDLILSDIITVAGESYIIKLASTVLELLHELQLKLADKIDYSYCYQTGEFNPEVIDYDMDKFIKYYPKFGSLDGINFTQLRQFFISILNELKTDYFLYRDFQPRNVMLKSDEIYFIDFQSGRRGPLYYDAASFILSGSFKVDNDIKEMLIDKYATIISGNLDETNFNKYFYSMGLLRIIQLLGSYSFSITENKKDWVESKFEVAYGNLEFIKDHCFDEKIASACRGILINRKC